MASEIEFKLKYLRFPGKAGELQSAGDMSGLIRELASDYPGYHEALAAYQNKLGTEPDPKDFDGDFARYCVACAKAIEVGYAEVFLRQCLAYVESGRSFDDFDAEQGPIGDSNQRIVSVLTGKATDAAGAGVPAREQVPVPFALG